MDNSKTLTYEIAKKELEQIVADIEDESVGVDALAEKVKRATALIQYCQTKLRTTATLVDQSLNEH